MYTKGPTMGHESLYIQFGEHLEKFLYIFTKKRFWQIIEAFAWRFIQLSQLFSPQVESLKYWKIVSHDPENTIWFKKYILWKVGLELSRVLIQEDLPGDFSRILDQHYYHIPTIRSWIYYSLSAHFMWTPATTSS